MKVSIIIPCYNCEKYIAETLNSALNQTYPDIEIICFNDGSKDKTKEIIEKFTLKHKNIKLINEKENHGVMYARNSAIEQSSGQYILPLDGDDTIEKTYVEKAVAILNSKPEVGIVYSKAMLFGAKNKPWNLEEFNSRKILIQNQIFASALFRKDDFIRAGKYKEDMQEGCEDWDLWLSFIALGLKPYRIDEYLFNYRQHRTYSRTTTAVKHQKEIFTKIFNHHKNLYNNNDDFILDFYEYFEKRINSFKRRYAKYKKLFKISLILNIIEIVVIFYLIFFVSN